jgi:hypothetical protein
VPPEGVSMSIGLLDDIFDDVLSSVKTTFLGMELFLLEISWGEIEDEPVTTGTGLDVGERMDDVWNAVEELGVLGCVGDEAEDCLARSARGL